MPKKSKKPHARRKRVSAKRQPPHTGFELKILFGVSTSKNYKKVISLPRRFPGFSEADDEHPLNELTVGIAELRKHYDLVRRLWELVHSWKSSEAKIDGEVVPGRELQETFSVIECAGERDKAVIQEDHCKLWGEREGWGCKHLQAIGRYLPGRAFRAEEGTYWYTFGRFKSETVWEVDKRRLLQVLRREVDLKKLYLCPAFSFENVERITESLPDRIDVSESEDWEVEVEEHPDGITLEKTPIGIRPKHLDDEDDVGGLAFGIEIGAKDTEPQPKNRFIPEVTFRDIGGIEDIIQTIREVIELPLRQPGLFKHMGMRPHRGILLYGPPGCGKTLIAKAIANEIKAHFISVSGPELLSKWHGQSEENLRNIFVEGRTLQPSVIFFDEIDSVAQRRSAAESLRFDSRFVNQLLTLMDGIEEYGNVCVVASTNRPELVDAALRRPGRFDYSLEVKRPTKQGCAKILRIATRNMPLAADFNAGAFSEELAGLTGADIAFVAREAAYNCLRRSLDLKKAVEWENYGPSDYGMLRIAEDDFRLALQAAKAGDGFASGGVYGEPAAEP